MATELKIHLNARLQPMDRGEVFEDPLEVLIAERGLPAEITGGGTRLGPDGEPLSCDLDLALSVEGPDSLAACALIIDALQEQGAPFGSSYRLGDAAPVAFGVTEGAVIYLNGTDLPAEIYASSDVNDRSPPCRRPWVRTGRCSRIGRDRSRRRSTCMAHQPSRCASWWRRRSRRSPWRV
jgi:hypothetical protein